MWISDFSIKKPVITTAVVVGLVVMGLFALFLLDTDEFPEVNPPVVAVSVAYPGGSPTTVEREIVDPLEEAFTSISGVKKITSQAMDSLAILIVELNFDKDPQTATQDIRDKISEKRRDLPPEMEEPVLTRFDPSDLPIMSIALTSETRNPAELSRIADPRVVSALRAVQGVADARLVGDSERQLAIELNPTALNAAGLDVRSVVAAVQAQNLAAPVGRVTSDWNERAIRLRGRFPTPDDFEQLVVGGGGTNLVRLGQVSRVNDSSEEARSAAMFNEQPAVGIDVIKAKGYSTTAVTAALRESIAELRKELPTGVTLRIASDAGERVERSVRDVEKSLLEGALLTVLVVFVFLNSWRSTIITGLALPVSVLASFIAVWAFGFTLNTMSLLGLSLAIGILIDDAIVVRENIVRHMERGSDHVRAAGEGTSEIGLAVTATTLSIVVVFIPVAFMGGVAEQWFAPFALTIAASVLVSLFVSFSLDPMLSSIWADPSVAHSRRGRLGRALAHFNAWVDRSTRKYQRLVGWAVHHRLAMAAIAVLSLVCAIALAVTGIVGSEFFPRQDRSEFRIVLRSPPGANLAYTVEKAREASAIARRLPEVSYTYTTLGGQTGESVDEASIYVRLVPKAQRARDQAEISTAVRSEVGRLVGVTSSLQSSNFNPQKQIQIQVQGPDLEQLLRISNQIAAEVRAVPGAVDVDLSSKGQAPELEVHLDRQLAGALEITAAAVAQTLRAAFAGIDSGDWVDPSGQTRDVVVRLAAGARTRRSDLVELPIATRRGGVDGIVPLGQIAEIDEAMSPAVINHLDRQRVVNVEANTAGRPLTQVIQEIDARIAKLSLPSGYEVTQGGETQDQREVFRRILVALGVAVLLMYLVLVMQFNSFLDPVSIMVSLPLSLVGVMLGLWVTGSTVNLMSLIGVILLMGIVAKNAILLIDFAKDAERRGLSRKDALVEAGGVRLRPIVMTSMAIIAGMLPVAIGAGEGADFRAPLGRAVIGGVLTSTLLTLIVIPAFYDSLASGRDRLIGIVRRWRSGPAAQVPNPPSDHPAGAQGSRN